MKKVKIYGLVNPADHKIFYVGATTKRLAVRLQGHWAQRRANTETKGKWITARQNMLIQIEEAGLRVNIVLLEEVSFNDASKAEKKWFKVFSKIQPLLQKNVGEFNKQYPKSLLRA